MTQFPTIEPGVDNIFDRAVLLKVSKGSFGTSRVVKRGKAKRGEDAAEREVADRAAVVVDTNPEGLKMVRVSKEILQAPELEDLKTHDGLITKYLRHISSPSPIFRGNGVYVISHDLVREVDGKLLEFQRRRAELGDVFCAVYPTRVEEAREKLGPKLFVPSEYPPVDRVRAAYVMSIQYLSFSVPEALENISREIFERETELARRQIREGSELVVEALHQVLTDTVSHMVERLTPGPDGKPKKFVRMVQGFSDLLATFDARNITGHEGLAEMAARARALLEGVDDATLRRGPRVAAHIRQGMEQVRAQLDTMVVTRGRRAIGFDDDEAPAAAAA